MLKLRDLLTEHPGEVPVTLETHLADRTVRIATPDKLKIQRAPALVTSIEGLLGQGSIRERRGDGGRDFRPRRRSRHRFHLIKSA
ncbi:MAG TPA: hypothetical protein VGG20_20580 [Thermoanaerobaculia bacterium]